MAEEEKAKADASAQNLTADFLEALYGDPLRPDTSRTGRHLVIVSGVLTAVALFDLRLHGTSLIPIDFGSRTDVLSMLLAGSVLLLLLNFMLRGAIDLLRDREIDVLVVRFIQHSRVNAAEKEARSIDEQMGSNHDDEDYGGGPEPWWEAAIEVKEAADEAVAKVEAKIGVRHLPRTLRQIRKAAELGVPVIVAVVSLILARHSLWVFFSSLIVALIPHAGSSSAP